ncbi:MAG: hypothetical protein LBN93_02625 [Candidatus Symbiothrix sp.]|jgi:hypothetical protein|nr:hypothetical protein [Candidatus Symbiothrix sp.]
MKKNNFRKPRYIGMTFILVVITLMLIGQSTLRPYQANAQISIGSVNDSVTVGSVLDLSQGSGGLLLPQVTDTIAATRTAGMMVFSTADNKVYTYNGVTATWVAF